MLLYNTLHVYKIIYSSETCQLLQEVASQYVARLRLRSHTPYSIDNQLVNMQLNNFKK